LLEAGFDQVAPNRQCLITSWAYEQAVASGLEDLTDNRALDVPCYEPGYTLVEKLQTISTKYRAQQESGQMPTNFMRHYHDVFCLLDDPTHHWAERTRNTYDTTRRLAVSIIGEDTLMGSRPSSESTRPNGGGTP